MTTAQKQTLETALQRAKAENIHIIGKGQMTKTFQRFWLVSSQDYCQSNRVYVVRLMDAKHPYLHCNCQARGVCKHRAVVHEALLAEIQARQVKLPTTKDQRDAAVQQERLASWEKDPVAYQAYRAYLEATALRYTVVSENDASLFEAYEEDGGVIPDSERYCDFVARIEALVEVRQRSQKREAAVLAVPSRDQDFSIWK